MDVKNYENMICLISIVVIVIVAMYLNMSENPIVTLGIGVLGGFVAKGALTTGEMVAPKSGA